MPRDKSRYTWRYRNEESTVKHAVGHAIGSTDAINFTSMCGLQPEGYCPSDWLGTGTQTEYETVEKLPECKNCLRVLEN